MSREQGHRAEYPAPPFSASSTMIRLTVMGTDGQAKSRSLARITKRDVLIYAVGGVVFTFVVVMAFPAADTWYLLGTCLTAIMSVVYVAKAIVPPRQDDVDNEPRR